MNEINLLHNDYIMQIVLFQVKTAIAPGMYIGLLWKIRLKECSIQFFILSPHPKCWIHPWKNCDCVLGKILDTANLLNLFVDDIYNFLSVYIIIFVCLYM